MEILLENFGFQAFMPNQEEIVREILHGNNENVIVSLQSRGGKTSAFQMAGSADSDSMVLVINPSLALIDEEVSYLNGLNMRTETITHQVVAPERYEISDELREGDSDIRFFYVTPDIIKYGGRVAELVEELCERGDFLFVVLDESLFYEGKRENVECLRELRAANPTLKWVIMTSDVREIDEIRQEFGIMQAKVITDEE